MTILLIDGDMYAYKACRPRWQNKAKIKNGQNFVSLDEDGKKVPLEYTEEENAKYLMESWSNFQKDIDEVLEHLFVTDYLMAVKGPDNFRDDIYTSYKEHRGDNKYHQGLANFVPAIRKLAVKQGMALPAVGREADDYLRIWAGQCAMHGIDYVIASGDKDLLCIPGKHWRMKEKKLITVTPEEGMRFFYEQLLKGDQTDNIPGVPGIGPVNATKLLQFCVTEEQMQEVVISHYFAAYGEEEWAQYLLANGKMLHIQRYPEDYFNLKEWPLANELLGR